jgi:hypothetical protein
MKDDGTIEDRTIEVGVRDRVNAQVVSGLTAGERVVTSVVTGAAADAATPAAANTRAPNVPIPGGGGAVFFGGPF